jgi:hypothetical protein
MMKREKREKRTTLFMYVLKKLLEVQYACSGITDWVQYDNLLELSSFWKCILKRKQISMKIIHFRPFLGRSEYVRRL